MNRSKPLRRTALSRGKDRGVPPKVRALVRQRSRDMCEVGSSSDAPAAKCTEQYSSWWVDFAKDLHHLVKRPRLHEPWALVHLCRRHHEMCEGPYAKGRLVFIPVSKDPVFPKSGIVCFEWREHGHELQGWDWRIEVRERKGGPLLQVLAEGRIAL